ncbi:hypothetical protein Q3G72_007255 [Acer saccharum]|nr:hypothetical protein Q3G72_007255 [Acer saccharum]
MTLEMVKMVNERRKGKDRVVTIWASKVGNSVDISVVELGRPSEAWPLYLLSVQGLMMRSRLLGRILPGAFHSYSSLPSPANNPAPCINHISQETQEQMQ